MCRAVAMHPHLRHADLGRLRRRKEDVVVRGVLFVRKEIRRETSAEMIASSGRHVESAEDFLVLDVAPAHRKALRTEAEFAEFTGHRVAAQLSVVLVDGFLFP